MFSSKQFLPDAVVSRLSNTRVANPEFPFHVATGRKQRDTLAPDGKLNILAADHPAPRVSKVGENAFAMADPRDYLARIMRVLLPGSVHWLMATMVIPSLFPTIYVSLPL